MLAFSIWIRKTQYPNLKRRGLICFLVSGESVHRQLLQGCGGAELLGPQPPGADEGKAPERKGQGSGTDPNAGLHTHPDTPAVCATRP